MPQPAPLLPREIKRIASSMEISDLTSAGFERLAVTTASTKPRARGTGHTPASQDERPAPNGHSYTTASF
jgi:hypothetical protein